MIKMPLFGTVIASDKADISTDPQFPKQLFPSQQQCPECFHIGNEKTFEVAQWNMPAVVSFLQVCAFV